MIYVKTVLHVLAVLGLLISLGEMLGFLRDKDRIDFVRIMETQLECNLDHPGAKKFVSHFVRKNPAYRNINIDGIEKIKYVGLFLASPNEKGERSVTDVVSGSLKLRDIHGQTTKGLCTFEELKSWAKEAPFWKWLGWGIVAGSVFLAIILSVIEEVIKRQGNV